MNKSAKAAYMIVWRRNHPRYQTVWKHNNVDRSSWIKLKCRIRELGLVLELTKSEYLQLRNNPCYYCGDAEFFKVNIGYGLDKIDPKAGYIKSNLVPCCGTCNRMKMDMSQADFLDKCIKISSLSTAKN